jgi:hypothetical protein
MEGGPLTTSSAPRGALPPQPGANPSTTLENKNSHEPFPKRMVGSLALIP